MILTVAALLVLAGPADEKKGAQIYAKKCASCHGADGQGSKDHGEPLAGKRPLDKLALYIEKSMPEDAPGTVKGQDAKDVAEYVFNAFYSPAAQARSKPPRIELSRLTVAQYRNAVADLAAAFADPVKSDGRRGLRAEFFNGARRFRDDRRVVDRVDPKVQFDFGGTAPAEKVTVEEYSVRWTGSVAAPETGEYEFVLEGKNGARLFVNGAAVPLVDGWVRSGTEVRLAERVHLLGGRSYPLRLEFFKSKQEKTAGIALKWKRPHRAEEVIPDVFLSPGSAAEALVIRTPFPPDDRSMGFERSSSISKAWDEAVTAGALEAASAFAARWATRTDAKILCRRLAARAFRRPLSPEQQTFFVDRHFEGIDAETGVKRAVLLVLKSPRFLYPGLESGDAYDTATRISLGLWDSIPDDPLLEAAKSGGLDTRDGVLKQVERMLPDSRTRGKLREFFHRWLQLDRLQELSKDSKRFPDFNEHVVSDLRDSLDLLVSSIVWGEASDFRQLLLSDEVHMNGRLAKFYGIERPADAPFEKIDLGPDKQSGILTHPLLMAGFAYDSTSSPIHRGLFVARSLLGKRLRPPPEAVTPVSPDLHPDLSTRERIALQTKAAACQSCHTMINPLGFALENFDAVGRFRPDEKGKPIDASGSYSEPDGDAIKFTGPRQLGEYLAGSEETHAAFVEHLFQFAIKQPMRAYGHDTPEKLRADFARSGFSIRKLLVQVVATSARPPALKGKNP